METNRESGSTSIYEKVMLATFRCVANSGLSRTTVEEVAQESGVSRSTIYRYFPGGKDELIQSVVAWEAARFFAKLASDISGSDNVVELVECILTELGPSAPLAPSIVSIEFEPCNSKIDG